MSKIKVCGLTRVEDVCLVRDLGVDFAGFVFAPGPRQVDVPLAKRLVHHLSSSEVQSVGVFVDEEAGRLKEIVEEVGLARVQLHGDESAEYAESLGVSVIRAIRVRDRESLERGITLPADCFLLDAYDPNRSGGTGKPLRWEIAREFSFPRPFFLAGGLTPENVASAIEAVCPGGVDVSTGVEVSPGVKSEEKVRQFVQRARAAFVQKGER